MIVGSIWLCRISSPLRVVSVALKEVDNVSGMLIQSLKCDVLFSVSVSQ